MTIDELEAYFNSREVPKTIKLGQGITITDTKLFIQTNIARARLYGMKPVFGTAYADLIKLRDVLEGIK